MTRLAGALVALGLVASAVGCASGGGSGVGEPEASPSPSVTAAADAGTPAAVAATPTPAPQVRGAYGPLQVDLADPGTRSGTVEGPDGPRTFHVDLPDPVRPGSPLLIALHGYTQGSAGFEVYTGLSAAATARGIVTVRPDGVEDSWNGGESCCPPATREDVDDVGFLAALAEGLGSALDLDTDRTWVVGFSNGGFLALRSACEAPDVFEAVVSHAGTMDLPCEPAEPASVFLSHGDRDPVIPFENGRGPVSPQAEGRGARDVFDAWRRLDGCPEPTRRGSLATQEHLAAPCEDGTAVGLAVWDGVGHTWPAELNQLILDWLAEDAERRG